jgi:hypothetical protein
MSSIYDNYRRQWNDNYTEDEIFGKFDSSNIEQSRKTVITMHNSKSYQVDGMTSEFNPLTYNFYDKKTNT